MAEPKPLHSRFRLKHWAFAVALVLLTWGLRLCCLDAVPPGWRDDELINSLALSGELLAGRFPLYFTGASGHEPLYHWLYAGVHAVLGFNPLSAHLLSAVLGTLTVLLTYLLARRLFGRVVGMGASLALATSFWSLMYSRIALRHVSLPPLALAAFYLLWRAMGSADERAAIPVMNIFRVNRLMLSRKTAAFDSFWTPKAVPPPHRSAKTGIADERGSFWGRFALLGLALSASLYTYPAARMLPLLLILFTIYLALFHRRRFRRVWRGILLALAVAGLLVAPMGIAIVRGRAEAGQQASGIGADARIAELAVPLQALLAGDPGPLLENVWATLGMFHATGDPEWLYNIPGRPVFNGLGGGLFWLGVLLCVYRWRRPRYLFILLWLGAGLAPTFLSIPPASLSHTILAQPVAYVLPILPLVELYRWLTSRASGHLPRIACVLIALVFLLSNAVRDLHDYFIVWPRQAMVRVLYRAHYRAAARYLDHNPALTDVAVSSTLLGPWDRLALDVDIQREDVAVRLFDPGRALVWSAADAPSTVLMLPWPHATAAIEDFLESPEAISPHVTRYTLPPIPSPQSAILFSNGLALTEARWIGETDLLTVWYVAAPLDVPPQPVVANPPPPGVYSGPRVKVFAHVLASDGTFVAGADGLWVDPLTLRPGDRFVQVHRFALPPDAPAAPYGVRLGLYDPKTDERWRILDADGQPADDHVLLGSEN